MKCQRYKVKTTAGEESEGSSNKKLVFELVDKTRAKTQIHFGLALSHGLIKNSKV